MLPLAVALVTALRLWIASAGPDTDTDAYGHAMAGRMMLRDPTDLQVHWVWLPLWHAIHAGIAAAGGGIAQARLLNIALSAIAPFVLARMLRRSTGDEALGSLAGALLALWPLGVSLGQSGQPEPLFQLLVLGACAAWQEDRPALAGSCLSAAALCRYEAWVLPPAFLALWWWRRSARGALAWLLPGATIIAWAVVHRTGTGEWLKFLRENREFAQDAARRLGVPGGSWSQGLRSVFWYPITLPRLQLGLLALFTLAGAVSMTRKQVRLPASLVATGLTILVFLTYGWVRRLNLGLPRHFYSLVPLYAAVTAAGVVAVARAVVRRYPRTDTWPLLPLAALLLAGQRTIPDARWNHWAHGAAFPAARAAAEALRAARPTPADRVLCDPGMIEQLSGLPTALFLRRPVASLTPADAARLLAGQPAGARLLVLGAPGDLAPLRPAARVLFEDASQALIEIALPGSSGGS
jgi:hypothetical protein